MPALTLPGLASIGWPVIDRFRIGPLELSPHGLFIAIGFLIGAWLFARIGARRGISAEAANSIALWSLIGAIVGARVGYVIGHWSEFADTPVEVIYVWKGGISLLGGIAGATVANAVNIRRFGLRFLQVADSIAPALALGIAIGRIGDLIIADHLGKPTSWFLAWTYRGGTIAPPFTCVNDVCQAQLQDGHVAIVERSGARLLDAAGTVIAQGAGVHQAALYDMLLAWALFGVIWWFSAKDRREGTTALLFTTWYACARIVEDSLRIDKRFGPFTGSQWTALTVVVVSLAILLMWAATRRPGPTTRGRRTADEPVLAEPVAVSDAEP
ncbi:MAG TPA: prolipoprotein diacylglyceryl transferase family protein [Actinomycetota bacterium]